MYECPGCGASLRFDPATQMMLCTYCGTKLSPNEAIRNKGAEEHINDVGVTSELDGKEYEVYYYTCPQCGGVMMTEDNTAQTFCSYCGASTTLEVKLGREKMPKFVIPFKVTREDCEKAYRNTLSRAIFAPSSMKKDENIERFRGIYMPYWIYKLGSSENTIAVSGKKEHRSGDYVITDTFSIVSPLTLNYSGVSYDASSSFEDRFSEAIAPFDLQQSVYFSSAYLSGFYADTADVDKELYDADAKFLVGLDAADKLSKSFNYASYGVTKDDIGRTVEKGIKIDESDLGMFPVWFLANRDGDDVSYAVVNGQTGKVAMDIPIDIKKYILGSVILAVIIAVLLILFGADLNVNALLCVVAIVDVFVWVIANSQLNKLFVRENLLNDKGYNSTRTDEQRVEMSKKVKGRIRVRKSVPEIKNPGAKVAPWVVIACILGSDLLPILVPLVIVGGIIYAIVYGINHGKARTSEANKIIATAPPKEKMPVLIKPIIAISLTLIVMLLNGLQNIISLGDFGMLIAQDPLYYGTAIVSTVLTILTVFDLVRQHNRLTRRKLPQFNKRGGEEYENQ